MNTNKSKSILFIVTSCNNITDSEATGLWLEEFTIPFTEFKARGFQVSVASIQGGEAPIDPRSAPSPEQEQDWAEAISALQQTRPVASITHDEFQGVFMPGGHGTMFDFPSNHHLQNLLRAFATNNKVIAAVCHGPSCLVGVTLEDGASLVAGKRVTGFTNDEEAAAGLTDKMPFLLESRLRALGADFVAQANWSDHVEIDANLITGQNPQSSRSAARAMIESLLN